jgi:short subunit dehydrogenase-like uncharacterized protein
VATQPDLAVAVLGATGVTGRRAVDYLRDRAPELGVSWAVVGRDEARLEALLEGWPEASRPEVVRADVADAASLAALARRARVLVSFAGPFAQLAPPVIAACVEAGTHYVDVTGEIGFVARVIDQHHERARERGAKIVQVAGFEALPFDLLTRLAIERLAAEHGARAESVELVVRMMPPPGRPHPSDGISAGTFESLRNGLRTGDMGAGDPAALVAGLADPETVRRTSPIPLSPRRDPERGLLGPMVPSPDINPPVIQRSLALQGLPPVRYRELVALNGLVRPQAAQLALAGTLGAVNGAFRLLASTPGPVRRAGAAVLGAVVPHSASGPRPDRIEAWAWAIDGTARAANGAEVKVGLEARGHPGYLATSRMTAEAGLILADPRARLPDLAGCLTPASALGVEELGRFEAAGLKFTPS